MIFDYSGLRLACTRGDLANCESLARGSSHCSDLVPRSPTDDHTWSSALLRNFLLFVTSARGSRSRGAPMVDESSVYRVPLRGVGYRRSGWAAAVRVRSGWVSCRIWLAIPRGTKLAKLALTVVIWLRYRRRGVPSHTTSPNIVR